MLAPIVIFLGSIIFILFFTECFALVHNQISYLISTNGTEVFNIPKILDFMIMEPRVAKLHAGPLADEMLYQAFLNHKLYIVFYFVFVTLVDMAFIIFLSIAIILLLRCVYSIIERILS